MKSIVSISYAAFLASLFLVNQAVAQTSKSKTGINADATALNGAWQRVYYYNGKTATTGEPKEIVVVHDGFFSSVGQDSSGRWNNTHVGTFETDGNIMKNILLYSSHPERVGSTNWVEYELKGDTLIMNWSKKLITAQGQDITAQMPKTVSKFIRAKK
jgi:hypothetical protein